MGRTPTSGGVEVRDNSIRIIFTYQGERPKETLFVGGKPLPPTPPNILYARRLAAKIRAEIKAGIFDYATYFPESPRAAKLAAAIDAQMLHQTMDDWLASLACKASTKKQYTTRIISFWKPTLKDRPIKEVRHSHILEALNAGTWKSGKSRNNELSMIAKVFEYAVFDKRISENPCANIDRAKYQAPKPDPFTLEEAELIIGRVREKHEDQLANLVEFMFFTGLRTNEGIGLKWSDVDILQGRVIVAGGIVHDEETDSTKTHVARTVRLNSRALAALKRQKAHTYLAGGYVFHDPATGTAWAYQKITDVRTFWTSTLKQLGVRYRRPYQMRHTYATLGLMSGANPAFLAKQLGHSLEVFFRVYADWIDDGSDEREMDKIEQGMKRFAPGLPPGDIGDLKPKTKSA